MPSTTRDVNAMAELAQMTWASVQNGIKTKSYVDASLSAKSRKQDLRSGAIQYQIVHLHNLCVSFILVKDNLLQLNWWDRYFPGIQKPEHKMANASRFNEMVLYGTLIGSFSSLESYVRNIAYAIDNNSELKQGAFFYNIRKQLYERMIKIDFIGINEYFQLMQSIRNCIHNNGVYYDNKFPILEIKYKDNKYIFKNGVPPNCVQPEFIVHRIDDAIEIISKTSMDPKVLSVNEIDDRYDLLGTHETVEPI